MAKVVNLKGARKAKLRATASKEADANRVAFGRSKADKSLDKARADKARTDLDAHKRRKD